MVLVPILSTFIETNQQPRILKMINVREYILEIILEMLPFSYLRLKSNQQIKGICKKIWEKEAFMENNFKLYVQTIQTMSIFL